MYDWRCLRQGSTHRLLRQRRKPKMLDIAQSGEEEPQKVLLFLFGGGFSRAKTPNFHYTTRRKFCQVKNEKILHKNNSQICT